MNAERWRRLNKIFHDAAPLDPVERTAYLDKACKDNPELRAEVERLIHAHDRVGRFIDTPAVASGDLLASRETQSIEPGRRFGPYRVIREIGRGGMGAVYLAERADGQYEQRVALKLIKRGMDIDLVLQRFRAERQILASLVHPNIARLLDGGTSEDGQPYFVMEYIEGMPIDEYSRDHALSIPSRLRLFLNVCDAVSYAHQHRVIHRDIKPLNILVTPEGIPKLLDFGIAKALESGTERSTTAVTGFRMLTPEYASPEQIEGRHATEASDIYSLGVVLYELLTNHPPYEPRSRDPVDIADSVRTTVPKKPSEAVTKDAGRALRGDLDTIAIVALRKEPERRYQSVASFADALLASSMRRDSGPITRAIAQAQAAFSWAHSRLIRLSAWLRTTPSLLRRRIRAGLSSCWPEPRRARRQHPSESVFLSAMHGPAHRTIRLFSRMRNLSQRAIRMSLMSTEYLEQHYWTRVISTGRFCISAALLRGLHWHPHSDEGQVFVARARGCSTWPAPTWPLIPLRELKASHDNG